MRGTTRSHFGSSHNGYNPQHQPQLLPQQALQAKPYAAYFAAKQMQQQLQPQASNSIVSAADYTAKKPEGYGAVSGRWDRYTPY